MLRQLLLTGIILGAVVGPVSAQRVIFSDDLSSFPDGWTLGTSGLHPDTWTRKNNRWYSSGFSVKCTRRDSYPDSVNCWMQRPISLAGHHTGVLVFWVWQRTEGGYDYLHFEYSTDAGLSWLTLWSRSGNYGSWGKVTVSNIPANANAIRFRFFSDPSTYGEGVYLDDIVLYGMDTSGTTVFYDDMNSFPAGWRMAGSGYYFWGRDSFRYRSPNKSAQCAGRDSGYYNNMDSRTMRVINLQGGGYNALSFWRWIDVEEDNDYLDVYYHTYGGSWVTLLHEAAPDTFWRPYNFELPGNADSVRFRFRSDGSVTRQGVYIDDVLVSDFRARAQNLAARRITNPPEDNDSGAVVPVSAWIRNRGNAKVSVPVYFTIGTGSFYRALAMVDSIAPGESLLVTFPAWTADVRPGLYPVKCSTAYFLDSQSGDDVVRDTILIANRDVGVVTILSPATIVPPAPLAPQVIVRNHGNSRTATNITFRIPSASYLQTVQLPGGLPVRTDTVITFPVWNPARGNYTVSCSIYTSGDQIPVNNVYSRTCMVGDTGWVHVAQLPVGARGRQVKDGCCLACRVVADTGYVYALKGNNTCEFYRYNTLTNVWSTCESIPAYGRSGRKKMVKKGACATEYGGSIYAAKGNSTLEFWCYTPGTWYPWRQLTDVPAGAKTVREGTGAAAVKIGAVLYVYLLKGSNTFEFYRYNTANSTWEQLPAAPPGLSGKPYKNGSCIAYDSTRNVIYLLKGSYNEFFAYDVAANSYTALTPLPFYGREGSKRRVKDGAGMTVAGGLVYALKGGNTQEVWVYQPGADLWLQTSDYPAGSGKRVKGGGAIVYAPSVNALFATKGNNTLEFARYQLTGRDESRLKDSGGNQSVIDRIGPARLGLSVMPNPAQGTTAISYSLPVSGAASLSIFDVTGRMVTRILDGHHPAGRAVIRLNTSAISPGIYLLRLETGAGTATAKMTVER